MARAGRNSNHTGSFRYLKDRDLWSASISLGVKSDGRRDRRYVYAKTKREVLDKLHQLKCDHAAGLLHEPSKLVVAKYLEFWMDSKRSTKTRESTLIDYAGICKNHLIPHIGHLRLEKVSPAHIQNLVIDMRKKGASLRIQEKAYGVISQAMDHAVNLKMVKTNPCKGVTKPKPQDSELVCLSPDELDHFLEVAKDNSLYALYVLAVSSGLRIGELLALRWDDFDAENKFISVVRSVSEAGGVQTILAPKTKRGRRLVTLPDYAVAALEAHKQRMQCEGYDGPLIFCDKKGGMLRKWNVVMRSFRPLLEKAGLRRVRFHSLRHSHVSELLRQGVQAKAVMERVGHSKIETTLGIYGHLLPPDQQKAAEVMERRFGPNRKE